MESTNGKNWMLESTPAMLEELLPNGAVKCHLSPRNCVIQEGKLVFLQGTWKQRWAASHSKLWKRRP